MRAAQGDSRLVTSAGDGPNKRIDARRMTALVLLCTAFLITVMGSTSALTAAPAISRTLQLSSAGLQWALTAATVPAGALLLVGGRLADLVGRRRMVLAGLALLATSSLGCGVAGDTAVLVAARTGQGVAAAILLPAALALLTDTFPVEHERRRAVAAWSAIGGTGATAGLLLGGLVTAGLGWRWIFLINVPLSVVLFILVRLTLRRSPPSSVRERFDVLGVVTFSVGVAALLYGVGRMPTAGWSGWPVLGSGAAGVALLGGFAMVQRRSAHPILPPRLLRSAAVRAGNLTLLVAGVCVDGLLYTLTLLLQDARGYSALQYGAVAAVMTVASIGATAVAQRVVAARGARPVAVGGLAALALTGGLLQAGAGSRGGLIVVLIAMIVFGAGMGAAFVAGSVESLRVADSRDSGVAAAVQNICFTLGTALGIAALSTVAAETSHLAGAALADASPTVVLTGVHGALWAATGVAVAGLVTISTLRGRSEAGSSQDERAG
jgi:MFS family permease